MARYNLILKDIVYVKLLGIAAEKKVTLGKLINSILEEFVNEYEKARAISYSEGSEEGKGEQEEQEQ